MRLLRFFFYVKILILLCWAEIRDEESAMIALRAAQTGHLVLSTLRTNDAISAISRLQQLGIQQYEIEKTAYCSLLRSVLYSFVQSAVEI